ncbi:MAG: tannase/feruloyl esterase family alpha/beta hydrolase [Rhodospirillaceae bacterium]|nr:tannase/feruloyl esterase family alpha/beta hydrolase [Rhodospirillaceae bacterium]
MQSAALALAAGLAAAGSAGPAAAQDSCAGLADLRLTDVNVLSATEIPASDDLPAYCSVVGYVRPAINFEIRLPTDGWNGGFYMAGCGGFCGSVLADAPNFINAMNPGLVRGYAVATMDSGHWGTGSTDARWALDNRVAEVDWADRAVRVTAHTAEAVIEAYYGNPPEPSIFQGCSTGGRMANMLAVRDPELFDGIINGAPALDYTGLVATYIAALVQQNTDGDGNPIVTPDVVPLIQETVYGQCDGADGLEDGLISDPRRCDIDWSAAQCPAEGGEGPCLSEAQLATLEGWYETGAVNSAGERLYPATIPYGSEPFWWLWLTGNGAGAGRLVPVFNEQFLQFMAFPQDPGEGYTAMDFDLDTDPARLALMASLYNSDDPDLSAFRDAGGVMITWHGWADAIVPTGKTVDYYEQVIATMGGLDQVQTFNRLFLIPGVDHCGILQGPGIDQNGIDLLTAMENWLDSGTPPDDLMTTRYGADGAAEWTRPVCAYPAEARWIGQGDWHDGGNFTCVIP